MTDLTAKLMHKIRKCNFGKAKLASSWVISGAILCTGGMGMFHASALLSEHLPTERGAETSFSQRLGDMLVSSAYAAEQYVLTDVRPNELNDGNMVIDIDFKGEIPKLNHFMMANPPRVIVDLPNVSNDTNKRILKIGKGALESVMLMGNAKRLRLVVNLFKEGKFQAEKTDKGYRFHFANTPNKVVAAAPEKAESKKDTLNLLKFPSFFQIIYCFLSIFHINSITGTFPVRIIT